MKLILQRYRTLWDVVIDGRLARLGLSIAAQRAKRLREFTAAVPVLEVPASQRLKP